MFEQIAVIGTIILLSAGIFYFHDENSKLKDALAKQNAETEKLKEQLLLQSVRQGLIFNDETIEESEANKVLLLCTAIRERKSVAFTYKGQKPQIAQPCMLKKYNDWCVIGDSPNNGLVRTFKIKNMEELNIL